MKKKVLINLHKLKKYFGGTCICGIKLQSKFIEITLRHECFPVDLIHIFITFFPENTAERLLR